MADDSAPDWNLGDLRVGGPSDGANHRWLFAEFVLIHEGIRTAASGCRRSRLRRTS